jgi:hypothetical protein
MAKTAHKDAEIGINDNGFWIGGGRKNNPVGALRLLKADKLGRVMQAAIQKSEAYRRRFRHCATRSLMILRNYLGRQKRVGKQQVSAHILMSALNRISPDFPILKEARRECLEDLMDMENTKNVLKAIENSSITVKEIETAIPSPFAFNLALQGYMDILRIEDRHEFLRRMHEMVLAKIGRKTGQPEKPRDVARELQKQFSYDKYWEENEAETDREKQEETPALLEQLNEAARKTQLDRLICADICKMIGGDDFEPRPETLSWLKSFSTRPVQKIWKDKIALFLLQKAKEV